MCPSFFSYMPGLKGMTAMLSHPEELEGFEEFHLCEPTATFFRL